MDKVSTEFTIEEILGEFSGEEAEEVKAIVRHMNNIIADPERYHGIRAIGVATQLSAIRTKIGMRAQEYKARYTENKSLSMRRKKDLSLALYVALEENINCLKLLGRIDTRLT